MSLIYCGIDEAGYGPMLGPLCVAASVFEISSWEHGHPAPDLWKLLDKAVCRSPRDVRKRVPVADSKKLKLPNGQQRDPLLHLERGVLSFCEAFLLPAIDHDEALFGSLGVTFGSEAWYAGPPSPLPRARSRDALRIDANILSGTAEKAGVRLVGLWCVALCESSFNSLIRVHGSKGATTTHALRILAARIMQQWPEHEVRIVADRHGGRLHYADALTGICPHCPRPLEETDRASRYELGDRARVLLIPEAEDAHLPVALASMTAKLVRELAMARFNRYWCSRLPELKPTAGYTTDARRWLREAQPVIDSSTRAMLVRLA
ncbi:MAG: hypothetical protein DYG94_02490 [Leptolyngbya sp. PLA3]|nr:MAG: hypothetical protein EDM82_02065 [Cyanobacteria bacterium CYA]MCE7967598.1 hypothetical protein [Leptolyngbya sp. PL-A3]